MTVINLLDDICGFLKTELKGITLLTNERGDEGEFKKAEMNIYRSNIPEKEGERQITPCIVVQAVTEKDDGEEDEVKVRLALAVFNPDAEKGALDVLEIVQRIKERLRKRPTLLNMYGVGTIEALFYPSDETMYYYGEMMIDFYLPKVKADIDMRELWG